MICNQTRICSLFSVLSCIFKITGTQLLFYDFKKVLRLCIVYILRNVIIIVYTREEQFRKRLGKSLQKLWKILDLCGLVQCINYNIRFIHFCYWIYALTNAFTGTIFASQRCKKVTASTKNQLKGDFVLKWSKLIFFTNTVYLEQLSGFERNVPYFLWLTHR